MGRMMLDEAITAVFNDRARGRGEASPRPVIRRCSRCGTPGHYANTCTASDIALSPRADVPKS